MIRLVTPGQRWEGPIWHRWREWIRGRILSLLVPAEAGQGLKLGTTIYREIIRPLRRMRMLCCWFRITYGNLGTTILSQRVRVGVTLLPGSRPPDGSGVHEVFERPQLQLKVLRCVRSPSQR